MAESHIKIKVGSEYSGEGLKKANDAIRESSKELNAAKRGLGELTNAIGTVSPAAGTATSAVKSFVAAFTAGGIVGGAIELAVKGISLAIEKFNEAAAKAKQRAESFANAMKDKLAASISDVRGELKSVQSEISETDKEINDLVSDLKAHSANEIRIEIAKIRADMWEKLNQAEDEQSKELIRAQADHAVEELKATEGVKAATIERKACQDLFAKAVQEEADAHNLAANAARKLSEVQSKYEGIILERTYLQSVLKDLETQEAQDGYLSKAQRQERISITNRLVNLEKDNAEELKILDDAEKAYREAIEADTKAYEKKEAAHEKLDQATEKLTAAQLETANKLKEIADKADHDYDAFHNEGMGAPDADGDDAKNTLKQIEENTKETASSVNANIEKDVEEIRKKKLSIDTPVTVKFGQDAPNVIPTPEEVKKAREAAENAPYKTAEEFVDKWGTRFQSYLLTLDAEGLKKTLATGKYDDMLEVLKTLSPEIQEIVVEKVVKGTSLKHEGWRDFFSNVENIRDVIKAGELGGDENCNNDNSSTDNSSTDNSSTDNSVTTSNSNNRTYNDNRTINNGPSSSDDTPTDYSTILGEIKSLLQQSLQLQ